PYPAHPRAVASHRTPERRLRRRQFYVSLLHVPRDEGAERSQHVVVAVVLGGDDVDVGEALADVHLEPAVDVAEGGEGGIRRAGVDHARGAVATRCGTRSDALS